MYYTQQACINNIRGYVTGEIYLTRFYILCSEQAYNNAKVQDNNRGNNRIVQAKPTNNRNYLYIFDSWGVEALYTGVVYVRYISTIFWVAGS